ncbi:hypothetical protein ACO7_510180 [Thiomonas arsenitoxydans]|nr:hypothetical protein ACO3_510178 [Thiomonas arsenitoxydans]CQR37900.1 hypothetical protein ACO7_510180 [Thiomonas arsenitoxydans]
MRATLGAIQNGGKASRLTRFARPRLIPENPRPWRAGRAPHQGCAKGIAWHQTNGPLGCSYGWKPTWQ